MADAKAHTSRGFERELETLRERLVTMGGRAERQIDLAVQSLLRRDPSLAQKVIAEDAKIDQDEIEIDDLAFLILARRQPVASDLRFITFALKVVTDLERIGDLAVNIAKRAGDIMRFDPAPAADARILALAQKVQAAVKEVLDAFVKSDPERAEKVISSDRDIDALNMHLIADVISLGADNPRDVARSLALSSVSRYLERIGDHATNIAEMIIYCIRGRDVRHHTKLQKT